MILVHHFVRGFGHARQLHTGKWEVRFFDYYNSVVLFRSDPPDHILTFYPKDNEHDKVL
jgi:hypothetical protein